MKLNRFDDVWSGLFPKKIADHLNHRISLGAPMVRHEKRSRSILKDALAEMKGLSINEKLLKIVDEIEISGRNYANAYKSLTEEIAHRMGKFHDAEREIMMKQIEKMRLWTEKIDKIT